MADIRQSTTVIDDFERPNENPILHTVAHPWVNAYYSSSDVQIKDGVLKGADIGNSPCHAAYDGFSMSGTEFETWGMPTPPSYSFPEGTRQGCMDSGGHGYLILHTGGFGLILRRYTGGGAFTAIEGSITAGDEQKTPHGCLQLFKLIDTGFEVWRMSSDGDFANWTLTCRSNDTTYRNNLYMVYGSTGNEDGWDYIGGGIEDWIPQIYRRPYD